MSLSTCIIHFSPRRDQIVYASGELLKRLQLSDAKRVNLKLGQRTIAVPIRTVRKMGNHLYLPPRIRQMLRVPKSGLCMAVSDNQQTVRLGPLIGVMTSTFPRSPTRTFGSRTLLIRQLLQVGHKKSFYFAFSPRDINWQQETINGYFIGAGGGWIRKVVPFPDVIYNRLPSRKAESSRSMEDLKERFIRRNIPLFNWSFFDKSDVYNLLKGDPSASKYVPETYYNPSPERIKDMLSRHQFVYLKPTAGSLGIGIFRLTYNPRNGYYIRYRRNKGNVLLRFKRFSSLMAMLRSKQGRLQNYVAQQGIRLIEIDSCPIDFRFHMNKNSNNAWVVAGIGAKKAGRGSVTTHIKNGGKLMTPEQALSQTFGSRADEILEKAKRIAIQLANAIEQQYRHTLGELGFDIGIDRNENIWMFEANAKPGRTIFKHPLLKAQGKAQLAYIFDHCLYLSKFRRSED